MATQQQSKGVLDDIQPIRGAIYGGVAFAAGYVLTLVLVAIDSELDLSDVDSVFETIGLVFYHAHFVDAEVTGNGMSESFNILSENSTQIPELGYTVVPVVLLFGAGFLVARAGSEYATTAEQAAKAGVSIVVGYLPMVFLGTVLFETAEESFAGTVTFGPETGSALLLAGLFFPIVLGAVGGVVAQR